MCVCVESASTSVSKSESESVFVFVSVSVSMCVSVCLQVTKAIEIDKYIGEHFPNIRNHHTAVGA